MRRDKKTLWSNSNVYDVAQAALFDEWFRNPNAARVSDTGEFQKHSYAAHIQVIT